MVQAQHEALEALLVEVQNQILCHFDECFFIEIYIAEEVGPLPLELVGLGAEGHREAGDGFVSQSGQFLGNASDQYVGLEPVCPQRQVGTVVFQSAEGEDHRIAFLHGFLQFRGGHFQQALGAFDFIERLPIVHGHKGFLLSIHK